MDPVTHGLIGTTASQAFADQEKLYPAAFLGFISAMLADLDVLIGDGRYSMLPTSVEPLWGIEIDTTKPNQHVDFNTCRDAGREVRTAFGDMLLGRK